MKADTKGYAKGLAFIAGTFAVLCIWPVSYTHLTLSTIA